MQSAAVYILEEPLAPWLWPALALAGIAIALLSLATRSRVPVLCGLPLILAGAAAERDITLAVGAILAATGLCLCAGRR